MALGVLAAGTALAADPVKVSNAWVRATMPGQKVAGAYLDIESPDKAALVSATSPAAVSVEMHSMAMEGNIMKMRQLDRLDLPAKKVVSFKPGGLHLMLVDVKKPLKQGDKVPFTLVVEKADKSRAEVKFEAEVHAAHGEHMKH
ncbi:MAG: copper chaperone PCu(A)C [Betaproteobacteria bacterium]|nr:copper chaperone PCu(A)C [Betaproteobacteria bacterium]